MFSKEEDEYWVRKDHLWRQTVAIVLLRAFWLRVVSLHQKQKWFISPSFYCSKQPLCSYCFPQTPLFFLFRDLYRVVFRSLDCHCLSHSVSVWLLRTVWGHGVLIQNCGYPSHVLQVFRVTVLNGGEKMLMAAAESRAAKVKKEVKCDSHS